MEEMLSMVPVTVEDTVPVEYPTEVAYQISERILSCSVAVAKYSVRGVPPFAG